MSSREHVLDVIVWSTFKFCKGESLIIMAQATVPSSRGRPKKDVDRDQVHYFRTELCLSWEQSAALLGVSVKTVRRRAKEWNIPSYCGVTDAQLDEAILEILTNFPSSGETLIIGHLQAKKVQYIGKHTR